VRLTASVVVAASPAAVWPWLTEPGRRTQWIPGLLEETYAQGDPSSVGARFHMRIKEAWRETVYEGEITRSEFPRQLRVTLFGGALPPSRPMQVDYALHDLGGATRVEYSVECALPAAVALFYRLFGTWQARRLLAGLKQEIEGSS
jgi:carbon monoxide dehydrogenase subunit G